MVIAFGSALGAGVTDNVIVPFSGTGINQSFFIRHNKNGNGGNGTGILFKKATPSITTNVTNCQFTGTVLEWQQAWTGNTATWTIAGGITQGLEFNSLITYRGTATANKPIWYLNGISQTVTNTVAASGSLLNNAATFTIGNAGNATNRNWDGWLSHFAVWNRILSQDEATALSNGASPLFFPDQLMAYWPGFVARQELIGGVDCTVLGTKPIDKDINTILPGMF